MTLKLQSHLLIIILVFLYTSHAFTQEIKGYITDIDRVPIVGAVLTLNEKYYNVSDANGFFEFNKIENQQNSLLITMMGYQNKTIKVAPNKTYNIVLKEKANQLNEVVIESKTKADKIKEQAFEVDVLEIKELKNSSVDVNSVLQKIPGVNIRNSGGLGSSFNFSLNGLSGKKVRFFMDGIPLEGSGSALTLNNFPATLVERIDVYKGVVPINLASDALGGAINIITRQPEKGDFLDVSYDIGSFNTHRGTINVQKTTPDNWFVKLSSFYNYSDNNYTIDGVTKKDDFGNHVGTEDNIERFHDSYESYMIDIKSGVINKPYADQLFIGSRISGSDNDIQHSDITSEDPFGEVNYTSQAYNTFISYKKKNLIKNKLSLKLYASFGQNNEIKRDTSSYQYDWYGNKTLRNNGSSFGELGSKTLFSFKDKLHIINFSADYNLGDKSALSLNYAKNYVKRQGEDPFYSETLSIPFAVPHILNKNIIGLNYNLKLLDNRLDNNFFNKIYLLNSEGVLLNTSLTEAALEKNKYQKIGYGLTSTFKIKQNLRLKGSYEHSYRMADAYEYFGDGHQIKSNIELKPEQSDNYNLGLIYTTQLNRFKIGFDSNAFYRDSKDFLRRENEVTKSKYYNRTNVKTLGTELEIELKYKNNLKLTINGTYQELTDIEQNARIANIPYLFGNLNTSYSFKNLLSKEDELSTSWNTSFVEEYPYLDYVNGYEEDRPNVPKQLSHSLEFSYKLNKGKYNFSFLIKNLTNSTVYDNFNIQQPGRAFYLKLRYYINN